MQAGRVKLGDPGAVALTKNWLVLICLATLPAAPVALAAQGPPAAAAPLSLSAVRANYNGLAGHVVTIEGFLVFQGSRPPLFYQGEARRDFTMGDLPGIEGLIGFACMFEVQPEALEVHDLSRHDLWRVSRRTRYGGAFMGQRIVLQGVLQPHSQRPLRYGAPIEFPPFDRLTEARIISVDNVYCRGSQPPPGQ